MALSPDAVSAAYRQGLDAARTTLGADLETRFASLDAADIDAAWATFVADNADRIEGGKAAAQLLAVTFLEMLAETSGVAFTALPEDPDLAMSTAVGTVSEGLAAVPSMVKAAIAEGKAPAEAMSFGASLVRRFVDNEMTRTADAETERQSRAANEIVGWRGVVAAGSCAACQVNRGIHALSAKFYRHPGCNCERRPVFAA